MALVLDIDGTITTSNPRAVVDSLAQTARRLNATVHINTARSQAYCDNPASLTTSLADRSDHYCLTHMDVPTSKVMNMKKIQEKTGLPPRCVILVDDRPENIFGAQLHDFTGVHVDGDSGITEFKAMEVEYYLKKCAAELGRPAP